MQWTATGPAPDRVLIVGWPSFLHGEATARDVLAMEAARTVLSDAGLRCDLAWSPVFRPGGRTLEDSPPEDYTHLVFTTPGEPGAGGHGQGTT